MINFPVGDFLIRIKNAASVAKKEVKVPKTKMVKNVAKTLAKEGFIESIDDNGKDLIITLSVRSKKTVLNGAKLISKPGLRIYSNYKSLIEKRGREIILISTSKGILTAKEAIKKKLGGELIAEVW